MKRLRNSLARLKNDVIAVWFCARHPRTPFAAKALAIAVAAYAFSPIDLIPDFIPVLGYLDDVILLPLGIWVVLKLLPEGVIAECREQAAHWLAERRPGPRSCFGAAIILGLWLATLWLAWRLTGDWLAG